VPLTISKDLSSPETSFLKPFSHVSMYRGLRRVSCEKIQLSVNYHVKHFSLNLRHFLSLPLRRR